MHVRLNYGPNAGKIVEFPFHVGREIVAAGRGERVDPLADPVVVRTTEPPRQHRDPVVASSGSGRRGRR